jgi:hypothetical protein
LKNKAATFEFYYGRSESSKAIFAQAITIYRENGRYDIAKLLEANIDNQELDGFDEDEVASIR